MQDGGEAHLYSVRANQKIVEGLSCNTRVDGKGKARIVQKRGGRWNI